MCDDYSFHWKNTPLAVVAAANNHYSNITKCFSRCLATIIDEGVTRGFGK